MTQSERKSVFGATLAGLAGGMAWFAGTLVFFLPAQAVLSNPTLQSAKFLAVLTKLEPLPRVAGHPWLFPAGLALIGIAYGFVYSWIRAGLGRGVGSRGVRFGFVAWALMAPWFEFYLPWNVMHEPALLVLLELGLWLAVLLFVGITIAHVYERIAGRDATPPRERAHGNGENAT